MENPVVIFGAGSTGLQAYDIFRRNDVLVYGFLDDKKELHGKEIGETSILGATDDGGFLKVIGLKCEAFVAISERTVRERLTEMLLTRRKTMPVNAIHDKAVISSLATLGHGNLIAAGALLGPAVTVGHHCILHSGAVLEPSVTVEDFVTIGSGAVLNSGVYLEKGAFVGAGAVLVAGIRVGKNARIGAGSVVIGDVAENATVFGNPAQKV